LNALTRKAQGSDNDRSDKSDKSDGDRDRSDASGARQGAQNGVGQGGPPSTGQDATAPGTSEFNAGEYERNARRTGLRTVEGDRQAREQAHAQGKTYGRERTVESDRLAREKQTAPATATSSGGTASPSDTSSAPAASSLPKVLAAPKVSSTPAEESTRPGFYRSGPGEPEYPIPEQNGPARNRYEIGKEWLDHHEFSAADGQIHRDFTNHIRDQLGVPHETEQHGAVPHPKGGTADLSERQTIPFYEGEPEQPRRYRYVKDGYQPPTLGKYDKDMNFVPAPNKDQPYPKLRDRSSLSGQPYSPLEDTYDTKGDGNKYVPGGGSFPPIYDYGQSQPLSFPKYNKEQYDSLPEPLPRPRPPEADQPLLKGDQLSSLADKFQEFIDAVSSIPDAGTQTDQSDPASSIPDAGTSDGGGGGDTQFAASGGYISGPGTSTSDSIPAMLSDKEFVHNAKAVEHYGVPFMNAVNNRTLKFAAGGLVGNSSAIANFRDYISNHYADGGMISLPPLDVGLPDMQSPALPENSLAFSKGSNGGMDMTHFGTVNLQSDKGNFRVIAHEDVAKLLGQHAIDAQTFSTGKKPAWYGGGGR
jgi:hypothetical protein